MTLIQFAAAVKVINENSGNNASHYWEIKLEEWSSGTVLATLSTASGVTAGVPIVISTTTFTDNTMNTGNVAVYAHVYKTGTPGRLFLAGVQLEVSI